MSSSTVSRAPRSRGGWDRGKWIVVDTSQGHLLLKFGMGGETLLVPGDRLPKKWRIRFALENAEFLAVNFWRFGYAHYVGPGSLTTTR